MVPMNSCKHSDEWTNGEGLKGNKKRSHPLINEELAEESVFVIQEGIKQKKIINKFQDWLICTVNNLEAEDHTSETCDINIRYKYTTDDLQYPS